MINYESLLGIVSAFYSCLTPSILNSIQIYTYQQSTFIDVQ